MPELKYYSFHEPHGQDNAVMNEPPAENASRVQIWPLVWPIMLSNISVPLLGAVDTAILGRLPNPQFLGAVAVGASILSLAYWSFGFLRMGTTSLVARAIGRRDHTGSLSILMQSAVIALGIASLLLALQWHLVPFAIDLMQAQAGISALAENYCHIRLMSAPATLINYALIGWFIGTQDTRRPLIILVSTNLLNLFLDMVLIIGLGLNSEGAAWASLISEYAGLCLGLWLLRQRIGTLSIEVALHRQIDALKHLANYLPLLQVNRHLFVRTLCLLGVFAFFTAQGAQQGINILAANAILLQFLFLTSYGLDGFAHAAEALCGKAIGARNIADFYCICRATTVWALAVALCIGGGFWLGKPLWLGLFSHDANIVEIASKHFVWIAVLPLVSIWAYQLDGIFLGSGKTAAMQYTMLACVLLVFLPLWWGFKGLGNTGLWLAFTAFNGARGLMLGIVFFYYSHRKSW